MYDTAPLRARKNECLIRSSDFMKAHHPAACQYTGTHARTIQDGQIFIAVMTRSEFDAWSGRTLSVDPA